MRKSIVGSTVAALALGGAAVAFADGSSTKAGDVGGAVETVSVGAGPIMAFGEGPDGSFAEDLAAELDVSTGEVEQALQAVAEKHRAERQTRMAEALSEHLDGVSVGEIEAALAVAEEQMHQAIEKGEPPVPDQFAATLADELGLSDDEVNDALGVMREEAFSAHREDAERRLDEAIEAERLSEKEADAIRARFRSAPPMLEVGPGEHRFGPVGPPPGRPDVEFAFPAG